MNVVSHNFGNKPKSVVIEKKRIADSGPFSHYKNVEPENAELELIRLKTLFTDFIFRIQK